MACSSTRPVSKIFLSALDKAGTPRYICRSCRSHPRFPKTVERQQLRWSSNTVLVPRSSIITPKSQSRALSGSEGKEQRASERLHPTQFTPVDQLEDNYVEAETWDGLEMVGHQGEWEAV